MPAESSRRYAAGLWLFLALFAVRVVAQPLSLVVHSAVLPPFESWHSGALPYGLLIASQVAISRVGQHSHNPGDREDGRQLKSELWPAERCSR